MKQWNDIKEEFTSEGSLRDIYINDIDHKCWEALISNIKNEIYQYEFFHGDSKIELPDKLVLIKQLQESDPTTLKIFLSNGIQVNCHFFVDDEIEMDIDPRQIDSASKYNELMLFINWLVKVVKKQAILTHENNPEHVICNVQPKNV